MKTFSKLLILLMTLSSFNVFANQAGSNYFGAGYHLGEYEEGELEAFELSGLKVSGGTFVTDNMAIEGQLTFGVVGDDQDLFITDGVSTQLVNVDIQLDNAISVFLKGVAPLQTDALSLYGKLGFSKVKLSLKALGPGGAASDTASESGFSYGLGAALNISDSVSILVEYVNYLDEDAYSYTGLDVGYIIRY